MDLTFSISLNSSNRFRRPRFTTQPEISGIMSVGQTLVLSEGIAAPGPVSYEIIRLWLDGADKRSELNGLTWDTTGEDVSAGGIITYRVRATNARGSRNSSLITAVLAPEVTIPEPPVFDTQPSILGTLEVGETLSLDLGTAGPDLSSLEVTSFTMDGMDRTAELSGLDWDTSGEDISAGGVIALQVTATNVDDTTLSDVVSAILAPKPIAVPVFDVQPAISGAFEVGETLSLSLGSATPAPVTLEVVRFTLDSVDKRGELVGLDWDTSGEDVADGGLIEVQVTATNISGVTASDVIIAMLMPAPPPLSWQFGNLGAGSFDITASIGNSPAPALLDTGIESVLIGDPGTG